MRRDGRGARRRRRPGMNDAVQMIMYRVSHLLVDLGWVYFDLGVPPSCPAAEPLLPNSHQPRQNWADGGTLKIEVNRTQSN